MKDIKPRPLAKFLCKFVLKTPYGIGLGIPETMEDVYKRQQQTYMQSSAVR